MKMRIFALLLCFLLLLTGCGGNKEHDATNRENNFETTVGNLGDDSKTFGDSIDDLGAYDGYFEGESTDITVSCESGTQNAYRFEGTTLTFTGVSEDTVYSISGTFRGNIVIDTGVGYKFDLELRGFSIVCSTTNPITVLSGDEVAIKAKKDTKNYIYDMRAAIGSTDETLFSGAIHSDVDLEIGGKGNLIVVSENNDGIHSKDDLQVKNLALVVVCLDNALKGNDCVEITGGNTTLIASVGDAIKTSSNDISEKGNQRGTITIVGGTHTLYAACDGIDAAYNAVIDDSTTVLNIYTDKYSNYSGEVTATDEDNYYLRTTKKNYKYSVKYYNSESDYVWVNASDSYETVTTSGKRPGNSGTTYYYYTFEKKADYDKLMVYMYESSQEQGQDEDFYASSTGKSVNDSYDTVTVSYSSASLSISWTNYTTASSQGGWGGGPGGFGGMQDGNTEKGDHSTKGIKAANEVMIHAGTINIKSYDDAIHANNDTALENGSTPLGNVTVNGGMLTLYTNDDGMHADGKMTVTNGKISIENAYEGIEGTQVTLSGGDVSILSKDDGINGTTTSGTAIEVSGGTLYIYCTGDGIDSNSRASYSGIVFSGGNTVVISNSSMNSAIDSEQGYAYNGGTVIAIMPRGGMSNEATHCSNFSSVGTTKSLSLTAGKTLTAKIGGTTVTVEMPCSISAYVIVLGDKSASISVD